MPRPIVSCSLLLAMSGALACSEVGDPVGPVPVQSPALARDGAGPRSHVSTEHRREPFASVVHTCMGDVVTLSGTAHHRIAAFATPSDRVHFQMHSNLQGVSGVGVPSGVPYRLVEVSGAIYNYVAEGLPPFMTHHDLRYRLLGAGPRHDTIIRVRFHLTIGASGHVAVSRLESHAECGR